MKFDDAVEVMLVRVAAAFEMEMGEVEHHPDFCFAMFKGQMADAKPTILEVQLSTSGHLFQIELETVKSDFTGLARASRDDGGWSPWELYYVEKTTFEPMARGLYRLGFDDDVLSQLASFSAHDRMEMRLSMARHLWPQKWIDEENQL